ncbi:MAG: TIGR04219 family outer membrane beta-barrel protein [Pseudomonadales bacterium]|nr:TIGR04219 family outer membrane beta-barrel protein [Pseudomonadales bacterium]
MKKKLIIAATCLLTVPSIAAADTLGIFVGAGNFDAEFSGTFKNSDTGERRIDLETDLGLDESSASYIYIAFEHPIPVLPNIKLARTELDQSGRSQLTEEIVFDGKTYAANVEVDSVIDLSHTDVTLYYELLDNWVNFDLGLTIRQFDGEISITGTESSSGTVQTASEDVDFPVPLIYGKAQFDLPLTGFYAAVDANWIGFGGNIFFDAVGKVGYETDIGFGVEAGLRSITLEIDDEEDVEADMDFSGLFLAAHYHF